jgi:SPP1 family predicted phage head-tail adaptor
MANPGKMDRRLTVQVRTYTQDGTGCKLEDWADSFSCWGELVTTKAKEGIVADADRAQTDRTFRIRYRSGLASGTHRIFYQLQFLDIVGIDEEGRKNTLILTCRALQALTN